MQNMHAFSAQKHSLRSSQGPGKIMRLNEVFSTLYLVMMNKFVMPDGATKTQLIIKRAHKEGAINEST